MKENLLTLRTLFTMFLMIVVGGLLIVTFDYPFKSRLVPIIIGIPTLILIIIQLIKELRQKNSETVEEEKEASSESGQSKSLWLILSWIVGFFILIMVIGLRFAIPIFIFLYLRFVSKERFVLSISLAILVSLLIYGLFEKLLKLELYTGLLF